MQHEAQSTPTAPDRLEVLKRVVAFFILLLPGIVWFPGDAGASPLERGGLWLKAALDEDPVAALSVGTEVRVRVTGHTARVEVTQRFSNPRDEWVEGLYVFPLPGEAAVDTMEMEVGERVIRGVIQPREEARETYERARSAGQRASLVEQERPNMFTTSVANIPPRGEVTVRIAYLAVSAWRDARYHLALPLAITPRFTPGPAPGIAPGMAPGLTPGLASEASLDAPATPEHVAPGLQTARIEIELNAGLPLAALESPSHAVFIEQEALPGGHERHRIVAPAAAMDRAFELSWTPVLAPDTQAAIHVEEFGGEQYALMLLAPPAGVDDQGPAREVIFIIDTSGSMGGPSIEQARAALALGVARLRAVDRFNIIEFNNEAHALFRAPLAVDASTRSTAQRYIARLNADGGTHMLPALELALGMPATPGLLRQVVFITDGSVSNETEVLALAERQLGDARLFAVGIGAAPNDWFMRELAAAGRGTHTFITDPAQVATRMVELFRKLERPALVDLELHWPPGMQPELATPLPRDLYAGDPLAVVARLGPGSGRAGTPAVAAGMVPGSVTLLGYANGGAWSRQAPLQQLQGEAGIARLWARERIAELSRRKRLAGGGATSGRLARERIDAEIEALAMGYGLVSERTSLVAVDVTPARPADAVARMEQAPTMAPAGSLWARSAGFAQTATPAALLGWLGSLALAVALWLAAPVLWPRR
jgi:Ca-activated chloride channel family protein